MRRAPGELRQSQVVNTFGPGAMLDLPRHSVLVGGLDFWLGAGDEIVEPRLARKVAAIVGVPDVRLISPPMLRKLSVSHDGTVGPMRTHGRGSAPRSPR